MSASVASLGPFALAAAASLAPRIDVAAFRAGEAGHVLAMEGGANHPPLLVARLREATCVPGGIAIKGQRMIADGITGEGAATTHPHMLRDRAGDWHLHERGGATGTIANRIEEPVLWLDPAGEPARGSSAVLEVTSRLWAADYSRAFLGVDRLRTLTAWPSPPAAPKLIEAAGVLAGDIFFFDRPITCAELIVATRAEHLPHYTTGAAAQLWQRIADRVAPRAPDGVSPRAPDGAAPRASDGAAPTRLLLARRNGPERRLLDEGARATLARHGFVELDPDGVDIVALARALRSARIVAGAPGGALATLRLARSLRAVLAIGAADDALAVERMILSDRPEIALVATGRAPDEALVADLVGRHG